MSNPFRAPAKPAPQGLSQKDGKMIARVMAQLLDEATEPLVKRIAALEVDLAYARAEAEKAVEADLTRHLGESDDAPTGEQLERMAEAHRKSMEGLKDG